MQQKELNLIISKFRNFSLPRKLGLILIENYVLSTLVEIDDGSNSNSISRHPTTADSEKVVELKRLVETKTLHYLKSLDSTLPKFPELSFKDNKSPPNPTGSIMCLQGVNEGRSYKSDTNYPTYSNHVQVIDSMSQLNQAYKSIEVKAMIAIKHLEFATDLGFNRVVVEGDISIVMNGLKTSLSSYGLLISNAHVFENLFSLSYSYVKREDNKIAHYLAKLIVNYPNNVIWMKDVSLSVFSFVQANLTTILK